MSYLEWSSEFEKQLIADGIKYYGLKIVKIEVLIFKLIYQ